MDAPALPRDKQRRPTARRRASMTAQPPPHDPRPTSTDPPTPATPLAASPTPSSASRPPPPAAADSRPPTPSSGSSPGRRLSPVPKVNRVEMALLRGIDRVRDMLVDNTRALRPRAARQQRPALGRPRHGQVLAGQGGARRDQPRRAAGARPLKLIEIHREDIESLPDADGAAARRRRTASSSSATTSPSTGTTPPTSR